VTDEAGDPVGLVTLNRDLLFALPLAARWSRQPMRLRDWAGCVLAGGGIAAFLVATPPSARHSDAPPVAWVTAFAAVALVAGGAFAAAARSRGPARAGLLAVAAGTVYGLSAALTLNVTRLLRQHGAGQVLAHWQLWALAGLGTVGVLLSASMLQAGALSASLPVVDAVEPARCGAAVVR
jgi:hypothetical protein